MRIGGYLEIPMVGYKKYLSSYMVFFNEYRLPIPYIDIYMYSKVVLPIKMSLKRINMYLFSHI